MSWLDAEDDSVLDMSASSLRPVLHLRPTGRGKRRVSSKRRLDENIRLLRCMHDGRREPRATAGQKRKNLTFCCDDLGPDARQTVSWVNGRRHCPCRKRG